MTEQRDEEARDRRLQIGLIAGSDHVTELESDLTKSVPLSGINDLSKLLDLFPRSLYWERLHLTPNYFEQDWRWDLGRYQLICNMVTDADHNPKTLAVAERLCEGLRQPVINDPKRIRMTARDRLAELLSDIPGVIMPKTARLTDATPERVVAKADQCGLRWPLLVREPGLHGGRFIGRFPSADALAPYLEEGGQDLLLTEYANFASEDGLFRKCRFWCVGRRILLRHQVADEKWNLHGHNRLRLMAERPELREEEERALSLQLEAFPARTGTVLAAIRERVGLDYFGIDCHIRPNGEVLVFEANATMNYNSMHEGGEAYGYIARILDPLVTAAIAEMIKGKFAAA